MLCLLLFFCLLGSVRAQEDIKTPLNNSPVAFSTEPPILAQLSVESPDGITGDPDAIAEAFQKIFQVPDAALDPENEAMWREASDAVELLLAKTHYVLEEAGVQIESDEFGKMVDRELFEVRNATAVASLTRIDGALCIRITHLPTDDAILIGPQEILNPMLPRTSRFQKYLSRVFTFSGRNTNYSVRGRNVHLVRIANAEQSGRAEYLKKPAQWVSRAWYSHYFNAAFTKPEKKHRNSAIFSTLCEMGMMAGLQVLHQHVNPQSSPLGVGNWVFATGYSLGYGMIANGMRMIINYGKSKGFRFVKASLNTLSYSIPFTLLLPQFHGVASLVSVVGVSFVANKVADTYWGLGVKFDETARVIPGDLPTQKDIKIPYLHLPQTYRAMKEDFISNKREFLKNPKQRFILNLRFVDFEKTLHFPELGSRVTFKSILIRMGRFPLKILSMMSPVGVAGLLISIPVMSVINYNYAMALRDRGDINQEAADEFIRVEMDSIFVRVYEAIKVAIGMGFNRIEPWSFLRGIMKNEQLRARSNAKGALGDTVDFLKSLPAKAATSVEFVEQKSIEIWVPASSYTDRQIDWMLSSSEAWVKSSARAGVLSFFLDVTDMIAPQKRVDEKKLNVPEFVSSKESASCQKHLRAIGLFFPKLP